MQLVAISPLMEVDVDFSGNFQCAALKVVRHDTSQIRQFANLSLKRHPYQRPREPRTVTCHASSLTHSSFQTSEASKMSQLAGAVVAVALAFCLQ
jgi:hypothetical protein